MKRIILAVGLLAMSGTALAQAPAAPAADITRAAALAEAEREFRALDSDGNGTLDAVEQEKAAEQRRAERQKRMEARLARMSAEERARFEERRARWSQNGDRARGGRGGFGPGGRGGAAPSTLAEYQARAGQRFDRLDPNKDGVITAAEQAQLRAGRGRAE